MASTNFINECKNRANANRLGKIIVDEIDTPITNSDNLQSFEINSGCYVDGNIIGSVYASCLKANFIADNNNLTDKSIQAQIGVKYADLSTEYINMGKYTIERPNNEITANYSQITAYSDLYTNLDSKYICNIDYSSGDKTVSDLYIDVCNQLGLIPKTTTFINSTIPITDNPFTNGESNRIVLQTICKIACSFIDIDNDTNEIDLCWLSSNAEPDYTFQKNDYSSVEGGQVICGPINCLIIKNSQIDDENVTIKDEESIAENGEHSITISEDYILYNAELRQQAITSIWNRIKGMKYVDCKLTTYYGKPFLKLGSYIRIYISDTEYFDTYVLKHNFTYDGAFTSIIESPALTEQEIKTKQDISLGQALKNTQIEVNKQEQTIKSIVSQTNNQNQKISKVTQTVDELNSKIGDIADITTSGESGYATIKLIKINESEPITLKIRPTIKDISYIYPNDNLFPSDDLFMNDRVLRFKNITTGEIICDYEIPADLLFFKKEDGTYIYDEFYLNYDSKICQVTKRVAYSDPLGNKKLIDEKIIKFPYPKIYLTDGDYEVSLLGYTDGYIYAQLMASNIYTTQFSTKVEMNSSISQTKEEINSTVSKKVGKEEIVSNINQSAEKVLIDASKINIKGVVKLINNGSTTIDGNKITTGTITSTQVSTDIITTTNFSAQKINADNITTGSLNADRISGGTIIASAINLGDGTFNVNTNGALNCSNITATGGTISGINISDLGLFYSGNDTYDGFGLWKNGAHPHNNSYIVFHAGGNAQNIGGAKCRIYQNGLLEASNINITGGSINISKGNYYFNMGLSTANPSCSGLNVGYYGIKANSNITATGFAITDSDTGKSLSIGIRDYSGHVHYLTFTGGILTAWEYK